MFIRWKGKYAYLEQRYKGKDGKVGSKSKYLGENFLLALEMMVAAGEISEHEFKKLAAQQEAAQKEKEENGQGAEERSEDNE